MNEIIKRIGRGFCYGVTGGIFILLSITAICGKDVIISEAFVSYVGSWGLAMLIQAAAFGIMGSIFHVSALLYDLDRLPLPVAAVIHCAIEIICLTASCMALHWTQLYLGTYLSLLAMYVLGYAVVFFVKYAFTRTAINRFNAVTDFKGKLMGLVPYAIVLACVFWLLPLFVFIFDSTDAPAYLFIYLGLLLFPFTIIVCGVGAGSKYGFLWEYPILVAVFFLPVMLTNFHSMEFIWIYMAIYVAVALLSNLCGWGYKRIKERLEKSDHRTYN